MKGVIMAGGKGSRLYPLTLQTPKPLVPIMNRPVIEYGIQWLKSQGIKEIAITLHYLSEEVIKYLGSGSKYGVNLSYFVEPIPLGTAGGIRHLGSFIDETMVVISADLVTNFELKDAIQFHKDRDSKFTIITTMVSFPEQYGILLKHRDGKVRTFIEKPTKNITCSDQVNTGIYIVEPEILDFIDYHTYFDFSHDLFPRLFLEGIDFYSFEKSGYWIDVGQLSTYVQAHRDLFRNQMNIPSMYKEVDHQIWVGPNTFIHPTATLQGPLLIGGNCKVEEGTVITNNSVIGEGTIIQPNSRIRESIIWDEVVVGSHTELNGTVVGNSSYIGSNTSLLENSVIGHSSNIGNGCVIGRNVKVEPFRRIPDSSKLMRINVDSIAENEEELPFSFNHHGHNYDGVKKVIVYCPNQVKSRVIRLLIEESGVEVIDLTDGIKFIHPDSSWTQIYSHEKEGALVICSHSKDKKMALEITKYYAQQIKNYQKV